MAKAKKGKLTIEDALVPVEEQPYEIPENWCWTYLKAGFDVTSSKRVHKSDWIDEGIPFYRTRELVKLSDNGEVDNELFISEELYNELVEEYGKPALNDILISGVGTIGVPYVVNSNDKFYFKDGNVIWLKNKKLYDSKYIFYLYKSLFMINQIHDMSAGTTVDTYTIINANSTKVPLPPLTEQKRIVEQIESLFSKLDEAKEKAQEAIAGYEYRRLMILYKAFSGDLSCKWRSEHNIDLGSWKRKSLKDCSTALGDGLHGTPLYDDEGDIYFVNGNNFDYDHIEIKPDTKRVNKDEYKKHYIELTDSTVFVSINGTLGKTAFYDGEPIILGKSACYINTTDELDKYYLRYFFNTKEFIDYANEMATGSTIKNLGLKAMRSLEINLPSIEEQQEIVNVLDELLKKEMSSKELAVQVVSSIEMLKKSILAKAFRGELGTNNVEEESSIELLKQILD